MPEAPDENTEHERWPPEDELKSWRRSLLYRIVAAVLIVVFGVFVVGGVLRVMFGPDLGFLSRSRELSTRPHVREWQRAVVRVEAYPEGQGQARLGTGFNIDATGLVVTNRHVVEGAEAVTVSFQESGLHAVNRVISHPSMDLAVVVLDGGADLPAVTLDQGSFPSSGDRVIIIGNPLGFPNVVTEGEITGYRRVAGEDRLMEIRAPIHPGSSGSPVFVDSGQVTAVVFGVLEAKHPDSIRALAIPVQYLERILPR